MGWISQALGALGGLAIGGPLGAGIGAAVGTVAENALTPDPQGPSQAQYDAAKARIEQDMIEGIYREEEEEEDPNITRYKLGSGRFSINKNPTVRMPGRR